MTPLFSILHTSARPEKWREIYDAWIKAAVNPEQVEYVLCVDERWGFVKPFHNLDSEPLDSLHKGFNLVWNTGRRCYVDGVNTAAKASTGRILIVNADDQYPCEGWDALLFKALFESELTRGFAADMASVREFVIEVSTGTPKEHDRGILVMPVLSRARYERLGYVMYPEYESMYSDAEFCEHARQDGVVIDARHLLFPHKHPLFDHSVRKPGVPWNETDPQYAAQNRKAAWELGAYILQLRRLEKFDPAARHEITRKEGEEGSQSNGAALAVPPKSQDWLQKAESIQGWMTRAELEWLHATAEQMGSVAEIGCWKGRSTYALASACKGNVYAVDHFKGSDEPEHIEEIARLGGSTFQEFIKQVGHFPNVIPVQYNSIEGAKLVPSVDFVFIDGSHDYQSVHDDLLAWKDKATRLICGHDADFPDVARAVKGVLGNVQRGPGGIWFKPTTEQRRIVLCFPGEYFRRQWTRCAVVLGIHLKNRGFPIAICDEYFSNPYVTRLEMLEQLKALELNANDLLLWLDDDNPLDVSVFDQLLEDLDTRPDIDGVSGWCWIHDEKNSVFQISCGEFTADKLHWESFNARTFPKERKPRPMECGGFPCVLMRYTAIEKAGFRPFLPVLDHRMLHGLSGEDMAFWIAADRGGAKFLVDPRCEVPHFKYARAVPVFPEENAPVNIVACMMRVKNESRWITKAIESVKDLCGAHIYVMEDGSTDGTPDLVESAGAHLVHSPFAGESLDERRDKNWLMAYVKEQCNPDWILHIDGDEAVEPGGCEKIRLVLKGNPRADIIGLRFVNLWDGFDQARIDGVYGGMVRQSLFRPLDGFEFKSYYEGEPGHNHVGLHTSNAPYSMECQPINVFLLHFGYVYREDRIRKYRWITQIDPDNQIEDGYRHTVLGDLPEFPKDLKCKHGGPLEIRKIPRRMIPKFEQEPGPAKISGSAAPVEVEA